MLDISCQCNVINFLVLRNFPLKLQSPCMLLSLGIILRYSTICKFNFDESFPAMFSKHVILRLLVLSVFRVEYNLLIVTILIAVGLGLIGRFLSYLFSDDKHLSSGVATTANYCSIKLLTTFHNFLSFRGKQEK